MQFDINAIRGLITAAMLFSFVGLVLWAYSGKRKQDFSDAASLPLDEDRDTLQMENKK